MGFGDAVRSVLSKYAVFDGRASRPEFWWFALFYVLVLLACGVINDALFPYSVLDTLAALALLLPNLAVTARRLHDTDLSGWWLLIWFVPIIGFIALLVLCARRGTDGPNRYGPPPSSAPPDGSLSDGSPSDRLPSDRPPAAGPSPGARLPGGTSPGGPSTDG